MTTNSLKLLDPVQGLVDYVLDIKPYHTKIVEVLIEYVYNEFVDVTILEDMQTKIDIDFPKLPNTLLPLHCDGGYSTRPYGDNGRYPIISPNQTIPFESYPAINAGSNTFTVPGDRSGDLKPGSKVFLVSTIEDYTNVHNIIGVKAGVADVSDPPTFTIGGDQTILFVVGYTFNVTGTVDNDRTYVVSAAPIFDGTNTIIPVGQSIISAVPFGQLGVVHTVVAGNTGEFTVLSVAYDNGMIDSWSDISDPNSFAYGDDPHTIVTVVEPLTAIPALIATEIYVSFINIAPILVEGMLPYSNYVASYSPLPPNYSQTPDEGHNQRDLLAVVQSIDDGFGSPIPDSGRFTVGGDFSNSNVFVGDKFRILGSANNGIYTITSIAYDSILEQTTFGVADLVVSAVVDGTFSIDIQANVFIVDGDWRSRFTQGTQFNIVGSDDNNQMYTVLRSDLVEGKTKIRVIGDIIPTAGGVTGLLVDSTFGYSEDPEMCDYVPETILHVVFKENLQFSSGSLDLTDDLVVYNLENSDTWGFELPINSIISTTIPVVVEQTNPPLFAVLGDLWYNTATDLFYRYNGMIWQNIITAWWFDIANNQMHYRTKTKLVDTGWILDSNKIPGYSDVIPAVSETELIFTDFYSVLDVSLSTFTLSGSVPNTDPSLIYVTINNVPAEITLDSATEFTLISPMWNVDDAIVAKVFDRTQTETNAHVVPFNLIPHIAYHEYVTTDVVNNAYIIGGGNFTNRFNQYTTFTGIQDGLNGGILGEWATTTLSIVEVDDILGTITIEGDLSLIHI